MNSPAEELRISLSDKFSRRVRKLGFRPSREYVEAVVCVVFMIASVIGLYIIFGVNDQKKLTSYKPEIRLDSLIVCSTNTSSDKLNLMIWDLKFNISNPNNYSGVYIEFEVSIFSFNQTTLLTKTAEIEFSVDSQEHTSGIAYTEASIDHPDSLVRTNGTIRFDLKFNAGFYFVYGSARDDYLGDLVCRDAKVALSPSSCGSLVGDPIVCSYQSYYKKSFWKDRFSH